MKFVLEKSFGFSCFLLYNLLFQVKCVLEKIFDCLSVQNLFFFLSLRLWVSVSFYTTKHTWKLSLSLLKLFWILKTIVRCFTPVLKYRKSKRHLKQLHEIKKKKKLTFQVTYTRMNVRDKQNLRNLLKFWNYFVLKKFERFS